MNDQQKYRVVNLTAKVNEHELPTEAIKLHVAEAMDSLTELVTDPTTSAVQISAVVRGLDDTVTVKSIMVDHTANLADSKSVLTETTIGWKHQVPESAHKVYEDLAASIGLFYDNENEFEDGCNLAFGEQSDEISFVITTPKPVVDTLFDNDEEGSDEGADLEEVFDDED